MKIYKKTKSPPLTPEEIEEKLRETDEEMKEVLEWKKEEEEKLKKDNFKTPQAKSACLRALKKVQRRIDSVTGMQDYWKNRKQGMSHFRASIELNEYWASLKEKVKEREQKKQEKELPDLLKKANVKSL